MQRRSSNVDKPKNLLRKKPLTNRATQTKAFIKALSLFLIFFSSLYSKNDLPEFGVISIPKSGTHLINKAVYLLTGYEPRPGLPNPIKPEENVFYYMHFPLAESVVTVTGSPVNYFSSVKKIIMIRDLRDVCISTVYHILKNRWPAFEKLDWFQTLSFDDQLMYVITNDLPLFPYSKCFSDAVFWINNSDALVVRFEDLVGSKGNGSDELQKSELTKIAKFLEIDIDSNSIDQLAKELFGIDSGLLTYTFRKGKINEWKTLFNEQHKEAFKKRFNPSLILLGYENDGNW